MFGIGAILFCIQFPVLFVNLCDVVRGASHNETKLATWYELRKIRMDRMEDSSHHDETLCELDRVMIVKRGSLFGETAEVVDSDDPKDSASVGRVTVRMMRDGSTRSYTKAELEKIQSNDLQLDIMERIVLSNIQVAEITDMMKQNYASRLNYGQGCQITSHEHLLLGSKFTRYDEDNSGRLEAHEVCRLMSELCGIVLHPEDLRERATSVACCRYRSRKTQTVSSALSSHSAEPSAMALTFSQTLQTYCQLRQGEPGAFTTMSLVKHGQVLERQTLGPERLRSLHMLAGVALATCALLFACAVDIAVDLAQYDVHYDTGSETCEGCLSRHLFVLFVLPSECGVSYSWRNVYYVLLLVFMVPTLFMMALIW